MLTIWFLNAEGINSMEVKTIPLNVEQNKFGMSMCVTQRERERDSVFKCEFKTK